ncbi:MAG: aminoglycoside phosphotransferase family protein [Rhodospirillales bacterium]|nr:aminoglycoside phosphotransferase family protein [Rhodospirillales bacterium]
MSCPDKFSSYTDEEWYRLSNLARQQSVLAGYYNENFRLVHADVALLFRFPKKDEFQLDPRPFSEIDVYKKISGKGLPVPAIYYVAPDHSFQVEEFISGELVDSIYPPGQPVSPAIIEHMADFYRRLLNLEIDPEDILAEDWPKDGTPVDFFEKLLENAWGIVKERQSTHGDIYKFLKLPDDPFTPFLEQSRNLHPRPWRLMHADLHRSNMIEKEDGALVMIDWELALYGDPLFCIAAHLHRCRYTSDFKKRVAARIYESISDEFKPQFEEDLTFYLNYEAMKSILTDTVRFPHLAKYNKVSPVMMAELGAYYADNLNRLAPLFGNITATPEQALEWFHQWAR